MTQNLTSAQDKMKAAMLASGIPSKEVKVYGSQIVVTSFCLDSAHRWAAFIGGFAKVRGITESRDAAAHNKGSCLNPTTIPVWRTFAVVR